MAKERGSAEQTIASFEKLKLSGQGPDDGQSIRSLVNMQSAEQAPARYT